MVEVAHKHLSKISGAGIYASLQVEDLKTSTHSMNFSKLTHLECFNTLFWLKEKPTSSCLAALFLKIHDTMSFSFFFQIKKKELCVRFPGLSNPKALHSVTF